MTEELPPSLFNILRQDLAATRSEINIRLDVIAAQSVSSATFNQALVNQKERDDRQDARIKELEVENADLRKTKAQQWFAIGAAALTAVLAAIGGIVVWTATQGLSQLITTTGG